MIPKDQKRRQLHQGRITILSSPFAVISPEPSKMQLLEYSLDLQVNSYIRQSEYTECVSEELGICI